ncbi:MAG TPA: ketopantoate reductase family protein [Gemmatimonadaceae bacterium]|jgi:2-dehydropantoate 2-reductase|nr:ketopantoate reductase family protein [Gemmatimonadaceae bacterium]
MRFTIVGAGGIGAYFGGELARVGHEVTLFARGAHLDAVRTRGLTVRTPEGEFVARVGATHVPNELPASDVAIVAVKSYSLPDVTPVVRLVAERGADVVPLLNGVTAADELIAGGVPASRVLGGLARVSVVRTGPGVVERRSGFHSIVVGELGGQLSERATRIADALRTAGVDARASATMDVELWQKYVFITAMAAVCGLARTSIGPVREAPGGRRLIQRAVTEVVDVARARSVPLPDDEAPRTAAYIDTLPAAMTPSFLLDLESGGPTELDTLSGAVSRLAAQAGIDTPVHDTATAALGVRR